MVASLVIGTVAVFAIAALLAIVVPVAGKKYITVIESITELFGEISKYIVILTIIAGFSNVVLRYLGQVVGQKLTNNALIEIQWYLYTLIFLTGFAYILKHQINVRVDFWFADQTKERKALIDLVGHFLALVPYCVLALLVTWPAVVTSWTQWEVSPDPNGLPRAPIKAMVLVAFGLLLLQSIAEIIKLIATLRHDEERFGLNIVDVDAPIRVE